MGDGENNDMGLQLSGEGGILNCPSSGMNTNPFPVKVTGISNSSMSIYKSPNVADHFFGSGWDPIVSLSQSENFGRCSMISRSEFANSPCPVLMENQEISSTSHLVQFPSVSSFVELEPKLPCFGSGNFSEMVGSFGIHEYSQIANIGCPNYNTSNKVGGPERISTDGVESQEDNQISEEEILGASPSGKRRKRLAGPNSQFNSNKNAKVEQQKDLSGESSDVPNKNYEKKQKIEHDTEANMSGKQAGKQAKDNSNCEEAPKENYIHVRARKGQATNSHSLAERVRREKISERMRLLQELVPGCNKITGKAVMLDEIINYVQSLQQQVEFLSMKLATVNPGLNIDIERILSKDIVYARGGSAAILGYGPGISSSHPFPCGLMHGALPGMHSASPQFSPLPQNFLDNGLQSLLQMGFDSNSSIDNLGPNGQLKSEL